MRPCPALCLVLVLIGTVPAEAASYELRFSTYLGGAADWDQARDVCVDAEGNIYVTGGTASKDFPTTEGAFDRTFNTGGDQAGSGGNCDAFVAKFDRDGKLLWSTFLGSPNYDRGYGIEVDAAGCVYVCGRAGKGFPVTDGAFQTEFRGIPSGIYGVQNGFVAKLRPDGSGLVWASYVGTGSLCRDLAVDVRGNVYTHIAYENKGGEPPAAWFAGSLQSKRGGKMDNGLIKIAPDGRSVVWATWLSGSGDEQKEASVRVDAEGRPVILFWTESTDIPTTEGAYDRTHNGGHDAYIAKVSADGKHLVFATYFGGPGNSGGCSTHNLAVDGQGNTYIVQGTTPDDLPVTAGALQTRFAGGQGDGLVAKFDATGRLVASTLLGGNGIDDFDGISVDARGNVFVSGQTSSEDFPLTADAWQKRPGGQNDAVLVVLAADFKRLVYATRLGGPKWDFGRGNAMSPGGDLIISGSCNGPGWPVVNAYQRDFAGGGGGQELCYRGGCYAGDVVVAKFRPTKSDGGGQASDGTRVGPGN